MSGLQEVTEGLAEVTGVSEWDQDNEQIAWHVEVPEGVTRMELYFDQKPNEPVPVTKGRANPFDSSSVVTGHPALKKGDRIRVKFWWG
jgi:hypothetical protein